MSCSKEVIKRERRRIVAIALNISDFENLLDFLSSHFTFTILNAQLVRTAVSENVSDTIQFFMRRKLLTVSSTELMTWDRDADMIIFESIASSKEIVSTERAQRWTRHDTWYLIWLFESIVSSKRLHLSCYRLTFEYVLAVRLDLFMTSCQCRCLISWYKNSSAECSEAFFSLLVITFERSETWRRQRVDALNIAMSSFLEYLDWNEFSFESYMSRLHTFWLLRILSYAHLATSWSFVHWFADLIYLEVWKTLTESWATILLLSYACFACRHYHEQSIVLFDDWDCFCCWSCMTREVLCCVRDLLRSSLLWMHNLCSTLW